MSRPRNDSRLTLGPYRDALEGVTLQFELIRFSLGSLSDNAKKQFLRARAAGQIAELEKFRDLAKNQQLLPDIEVDALFSLQIAFVQKELRRKNRPNTRRLYSELTEDRLNQSELLLLVAHFESFMKLVHETFLRAAPQIAFGKSYRGKQNAEIAVRDLFDPSQSSWNPYRFLNELIIKEVKWLDAQSFAVRAKYFEDRFDVKCGTPAELEELIAIFDLRNAITHQIYAPPPNRLEDVKEQPLVAESTLQRARQQFLWIPSRCIEIGAKKYQSYFRRY